MVKFLLFILIVYNCNMSKTQRDTPEWLAKKMAKYCFMNYPTNVGSTLKILEPSAGTGTLADAFKSYCSYGKITCVELNEDKCKVLKEKGYNTIHGNFLSEKFTEQYHGIIAAPPFKNNIDLLHITKMYSLLAPQGVLVTLTSPYWTINNEIHQVEFREFLKDKTYQLEMLPDNTFVEKGKTVPTMILKLVK